MLFAICAIALGLATYATVLSGRTTQTQPIRVRVRDEQRMRRDGDRD
ncbi:MAG: hypothetical protein AAGE80_16720 [Pseudomonadota bacterium]